LSNRLDAHHDKANHFFATSTAGEAKSFEYKNEHLFLIPKFEKCAKKASG